MQIIAPHELPSNQFEELKRDERKPESNTFIENQFGSFPQPPKLFGDIEKSEEE